MRVTAVSLRTNIRAEYDVPTRREMQRNAVATEGERYDRVERSKITGILPLVWPKASPADQVQRGTIRAEGDK